MRKTFLPAIISATILFSSCSGNSTNFSFVDISTFHIDTTALKTGEEVDVLYFSGRPDQGEDYYQHLIVISTETSDTVNVLSIFGHDHGGKASFVSSNTDTGKLIEQYKNIVDGANVNDLKPIRLQKVVRNSRFPEFDNNHYPTVIGSLGEIIKTP